MSSSISITDRSRTRVGKERLEDSSGVELPILVLTNLTQVETLVLTKWKTNLMTGPCRDKSHSAMRLQVQSSIGIAFL